jgi:Dolichyl-phosphate-mannose-protein mannosyltransferase
MTSAVEPQANPSPPSPAAREREEANSRARGWFDRQFVLAMLLACAVLFPRTALVVNSQSERLDDEYHLRRGIQYLKNNLVGNADLPLNDPPLGEGLGAIVMWASGCWPKGGGPVKSALWGYRLSADMILMLIAMWKVALFLPSVAVIFVWVRKVYGVRAAWLALALLLVEPTLAAHVGLPTLDVLGMEGIVIACFLWWRFFERRSWGRLIGACVMSGVALMLKHTAVILPGVVLVMAAAWWWRLPSFGRNELLKLLVAPAIVFVTIWGLCFFDFAKPLLPININFEDNHPKLARLLDRKIPAATYFGSFLQAQSHAGGGHETYLFGKGGNSGVWYYFPVIATYKVPVGIGLMLLLGLVSLWTVRPSWQELSLLIPLFAWAALMLTSKINIGWRHFLPAYIFMLMLSARVMMTSALSWRILAWCGVAVAGAHVLTWHPDYLCYLNWSHEKGYLQISDSNVDWGQGLKAARRWIDAHPDRKIFVREFGWGPDRLFNTKKRIGKGATVLDRGDPLPREGVLIISVVPVAGVYERSDPFRVLRDKEPVAILGNSMLVYDLDRLRDGKAFYWPKYRPPPLDENGKPREPAPGSPQNANPWG